MSFPLKTLIASAVVAGGLSVGGCATTQAVSDVAQAQPVNPVLKQRDRVRVSRLPLVSADPVIAESGQWLKTRRITFSEPKTAIPVSELVRMLRDQTGVNITSQLPLGDYLYQGYGLTDVDGITAMDTIFGSLGLDYELDDRHQVVRIIPVSERSWTLTVGPRTTAFSSSTSSGSAAASSGASSSSSSGEGGLEGVVSSSANNSSEGSISISQSEQFWEALQAEIESRLTHLVPVSAKYGTRAVDAAPPVSLDDWPEGTAGTSAPLRVQSIAATSSGNTDLFREVKVGRLSINAVNGTITVQAPRNVLTKIGHYIDSIENRMGTMLEFEGRLILVSNNTSKSEGVDLSAFRAFAENKYGLVFRNNALDGLTVSKPPAFAASSASAISGNLLGVINNDTLNPMQVFMAFLESQGKVTTMQRPKLSTTSGVPVSTSQFDRTYVNIVSEQNQASGIAGAVASRQNTLLPFEFGVSLNISPRYDPVNSQVRAMISLTQIVQSGNIEVDQFVSGAGGEAQAIRTAIPLDRRIEYQGEAILKDGDLIILGGQTVENTQDNQSGITGLSRIPVLRHLFGRTEAVKSESVSYFALQVKTRKP
ncbi:type II secretion system protein GspD [Sinimarinibacterium sp. NLF-5-8]|uniref:type II secretion system protein GspD n=1 Tax=Sinimarinibacterium sp. NLF-5-8 TaxID=2698684 RepID=UPI00137BD2BF|nr:hypothetical protein [Sinimarinibacterium sp. NLF-5-8]QHS09122.1 hypothetical protein GT972_02440 [Sinimarinibacterium sp. NLF-5-8]